MLPAHSAPGSIPTGDALRNRLKHPLWLQLRLHLNLEGFPRLCSRLAPPHIRHPHRGELPPSRSWLRWLPWVLYPKSAARATDENSKLLQDDLDSTAPTAQTTLMRNEVSCGSYRDSIPQQVHQPVELATLHCRPGGRRRAEGRTATGNGAAPPNPIGLRPLSHARPARSARPQSQIPSTPLPRRDARPAASSAASKRGATRTRCSNTHRTAPTSSARTHITGRRPTPTRRSTARGPNP